MKTITECNTVSEKCGHPTRCAYDEDTNTVVMTAIGYPDFKKVATPEAFYSGLRCTGWEYIPEEDKRK